jgi:hypothetical protein
MAEHKPLHKLSPQDYAEIEAAVMETARGRWFLAEFARRNRQADTETLLAALSRIEARVFAAADADESDRDAQKPADAPVDGPQLAALWRDCLRQALSLNDPESDVLALVREYLADARDGAAALSTTAREMRQSAAKLPAAGTEADLAQEISGRAGTLGLIAELSQVTARRMGDLAAAIELLEARLARGAGGRTATTFMPGRDALQPARAASPPFGNDVDTASRQHDGIVAVKISETAPPLEPPKPPPPPATWSVPAVPSPSVEGISAEPQKNIPSIQELQKLSPIERLKAIS